MRTVTVNLDCWQTPGINFKASRQPLAATHRAGSSLWEGAVISATCVATTIGKALAQANSLLIDWTQAASVPWWFGRPLRVKRPVRCSTYTHTRSSKNDRGSAKWYPNFVTMFYYRRCRQNEKIETEVFRLLTALKVKKPLPEGWKKILQPW